MDKTSVESVQKLSYYLANGSVDAIIFLLIIAIVGLCGIIVWANKDRNRLIKAIGTKDQKFEAIIDKFLASQDSARTALENIRILLHEIKTLLLRN